MSDEKKKFVDEYTDEEWDAHVASITPHILRVLGQKNFFDVLDQRVFPTGDVMKSVCDHTLAKTLALIAEQGFTEDDRDDIMNVFQSRGGFCDCEVLFNAAPDDAEDLAKQRYWREKAKAAAKETA